MAGHRFRFSDALDRMHTELDIQTGRAGLLQRLLDEQGSRLDALHAHVDQTAARVDALLARWRR
jgi:hypothetical protein